MNANAHADAPYSPAPGDLDYRVLKFLKENPEEDELTAVDIGIKFDVATDMVGELLRRATVHEFLRRTSTKAGGPVCWRLGARHVTLKPDTGGTVAPLLPQQRYQNRVSVLPRIQKGTPLMDAATRRRAEVTAWLLSFEIGDSATLGDESAKEDMRKAYTNLRKEHADRYFAFVETAPGEWGIERKAEAPKFGRKKGEPMPAKKKRVLK